MYHQANTKGCLQQAGSLEADRSFCLGRLPTFPSTKMGEGTISQQSPVSRSRGSGAVSVLADFAKRRKDSNRCNQSIVEDILQSNELGLHHHRQQDHAQEGT
jgi:hypothetical protein